MEETLAGGAACMQNERKRKQGLNKDKARVSEGGDSVDSRRRSTACNASN